MKKSILLFILFCGIFSLAADQLWERAVEEVNKRDSWAALKITVNSASFTKKGDLDISGTTVIERSLGRDGLAIEHIDLEGDFTPDEDKLLQSLSETDSRKGGVFDPALQDQMNLKRSGNRVINGMDTVEYDFSYRTERKGLVTGKIWIDSASCLPVRVYSEPEKTSGRLTGNSVEVDFRREGEEIWAPGKITLRGSSGGIFSRTIVIEMYMDKFVRMDKNR